MKYAVMASLRLETPAKSDKLMEDTNIKLLGRKVWGKATNSQGRDRDGFPTNTLEARFDTKSDMYDVFNFHKAKMEQIPILKGEVSIHLCHHDEGLGHPPCEPLEIFKK